MSKVTITISGPVGSGKSALCAEVSFLCQQLGLEVDWKGAAEENNLGISTNARPKVEIFELVEQPGSLNFARYAAFEDAGRAVNAEIEASGVFDMSKMPRTSLKAIRALAAAPQRVVRTMAAIEQRQRHQGEELVPNEDDPIELWAEIHRLRAAIAGPGRFDTWKDAAIAERARAVTAEARVKELVAEQQPPLGFKTWQDAVNEEHRLSASKFKEALHKHFDQFPIPTQLGVVAIMKHIEKVYAEFGV